MEHGAIQKGCDFIEAFMLGFDVEVSVTVTIVTVSLMGCVCL